MPTHIINTGPQSVSGNFTIDNLYLGTSTSYFAESSEVRSWTFTGSSLPCSSINTESAPTGLFFSPDGTKLFYLGSGSDTVREVTLSTPWDLSTAVFVQVIAAGDSIPNDLAFSPDGTKMFILGDTNNRITQYSLPTPWSLTGAASTGYYLTIPTTGDGAETGPQGLCFSSDGYYVYYVGSGSDTVYQWSLNAPFDLSIGPTYVRSFYVGAQETTPTAIDFSSDGTRMYVLGTNGDDINEYRLSTPWDISTAVYFSTGYTFTGQGALNGLFVNDVIGRAYVVGSATDTIWELDIKPQVKYFGKSLICNGDYYVAGRMEIGGTCYANNDVYFRNVASFTSGSSTATFTGSAVFSGNVTVNGTPSIGSATASSTSLFAYGANVFGTTKTIRIGTGGLAGSITSISIGSTNGTSIINYAATNDFYGDINVRRAIMVNGNIDGSFLTDSAEGDIAFYDTFTEASTIVLSSHIPDIGTGWTRVTVNSVTADINCDLNGYAIPATNINDNGVIYLASDAMVSANYEITATLNNLVTLSGYAPYIIFRYIDNNNFYAFRFPRSSNNVDLWKRVGGVSTQIGGDLNLPSTSAFNYTVRVIGSRITILYDGAIQLSIEDSSLPAAGYAGIGYGNILLVTTDDINTGASRFDDFKIQYYSGLEPCASVFQKDISVAGKASVAEIVSESGYKISDSAIVDLSTDTTLTSAYDGKILNCTAGLTITTDTLYKGFQCMVIQNSASTVTFASGTATITSLDGALTTAGQGAVASIIYLGASSVILGGAIA